MRMQTYELLYKFGPMTAVEMVRKNRERYGNESGIDSYHKRLSELRDIGVVYEVRERVCSVTGRNVIEWDVTDKLPGKLPPKKEAEIISWCPVCQYGYSGRLKKYAGHWDKEGQQCIGKMKEYKAVK